MTLPQVQSLVWLAKNLSILLMLVLLLDDSFLIKEAHIDYCLPSFTSF